MINQRLEGRVSKGCRVGVVVVVRAFTCQKFRRRCWVCVFVRETIANEKNRLEGGFEAASLLENIEKRWFGHHFEKPQRNNRAVEAKLAEKHFWNLIQMVGESKNIFPKWWFQFLDWQKAVYITLNKFTAWMELRHLLRNPKIEH